MARHCRTHRGHHTRRRAADLRAGFVRKDPARPHRGARQIPRHPAKMVYGGSQEIADRGCPRPRQGCSPLRGHPGCTGWVSGWGHGRLDRRPVPWSRARGSGRHLRARSADRSFRCVPLKELGCRWRHFVQLAAVMLIDDQDAKSEHQWRYLPGVVPYRRLKDR